MLWERLTRCAPGGCRAPRRIVYRFSTLYRFFSRARWEPDEIGRELFNLLLEFVPGDIWLIVDDTLCRRSGPHFWGAGMHHDPLKSTYTRGGGGRHLALEDPQNGWWRKTRRLRRRRKKPGPQPRANLGRTAVEHTVPLAFCAYGLVIAWYLRHGQPAHDVQRARKLSPWYRHKKEPSFADMLDAARREIWRARISTHPPLDSVPSFICKLLSPDCNIPA
jgi:hypothetical protein